MKPLVALVGRPNVGKSTLFNRIVGERIAIVEDVAGTTRDRLYREADWNGRNFMIVDTGGLEMDPESDMANRVRQQAQVAVAEADVVLFVVDARDGINVGDAEVANMLRSSQKPVLLVVNKADTPGRRLDAAEFFSMGLPLVFTISAQHGTGTGDLLDAVVAAMPPAEAAPSEVEDATTGTRLAFVGRPNVGKSSLLNALVGWERAIVTDIPGTTRDAIDTELVVDGKKLTLVDTAGVRRRGRIERGVEQYSVLRSIRAIESADIVAVVIDASEGVTAQDTHLAGFAADEAKGIMLVVNKWDLQPNTSQIRDSFLATVREDMKFAPYAPVLFVSALNGMHVKDVISTAFRTVESRRKRVQTAALNELVAETVHAHSPPSDRGRSFKIYYVTQAAINPPTFVFFVNDSELLHFSYRRYLENRLRQAFGFEGTAIRMVFRNRVDDRSEPRAR